MKRFITLLLCLSVLSITRAQQYQPTDEKSSVKFAIKNFGVGTGGSFKGLEGHIEFDKASPEKSVFDITVNTATVNTDNSARDSHLRKEEYFNADKYPKMSFKSDRVSAKGSGYVVSGKLTIKGTEKTISFPFKVTPGADGCLFEGSFQLNRRDYSVGGNSMVLGDNVTVTLSVFAKKK